MDELPADPLEACKYIWETINRMVQIGTVTDVDNDKKICRVYFKTTGITSDWLYVLDNRAFIPDYKVPQRTEYITMMEANDEKDNSTELTGFGTHKHDLIIKQWMPKVNETVYVLYMAPFNADGVVLGGINYANDRLDRNIRL